MADRTHVDAVAEALRLAEARWRGERGVTLRLTARQRGLVAAVAAAALDGRQGCPHVVRGGEGAAYCGLGADHAERQQERITDLARQLAQARRDLTAARAQLDAEERALAIAVPDEAERARIRDAGCDAALDAEGEWRDQLEHAATPIGELVAQWFGDQGLGPNYREVEGIWQRLRAGDSAEVTAHDFGRPVWLVERIGAEWQPRPES